jgi:hypothetical protein
LVDFDGDGQADIISGSYAPGHLYLFKGRADGTFGKPETINGVDGNPINVGFASAVSAADFDRHGVLDLVIGNINGDVFIVKNNGTRSAPRFALPLALKADGSPIKTAGDAGPTLADWNDDGTLDLLVGDNSGAVLLYENRSRDRTPELSGPFTLLKASSQTHATPGKLGEMSPGVRTKPTVADFNGDGRLDLLVGDVSYAAPKIDEQPDAPATAPAPSAPTTQPADAQRRLRDLMKQYQVESARLRALPSDAPADQRKQLEWRVAGLLDQVKTAHDEATRAQRAQLEALARQRARTVSPEIHGYVWYFERKRPQ